MSLKRYGTRRDSTERAIVEVLRAAGWLVVQLDLFDLLAYHPGQRRFVVMDCKSKHGKATERQARMIADGWPLYFVRSEAEALDVIRARP